jgi:NADPH:quinone reductase-like Zn-dependent oxidoreductase
VSGVVVAAGTDVHDVDVGDEVYGLIRFDRLGAAADFVAVPAIDLARKPTQVSHVLAAAVPLAALTAWQALVDHAGVTRGERVLVLGGAGGVGAFAVQLANNLGAEVTATARIADAAYVRELGADVVAPDPLSAGSDFDAVVDTVGGAALDDAYTVLRQGGRLVTLQALPDQARAARAGIVATFFVVTPDRAALTRLAAMVDDGSLRVTVAALFPVSEGRAAFESGLTWDRPPGKTVLMVAD